MAKENIKAIPLLAVTLSALLCTACAEDTATSESPVVTTTVVTTAATTTEATTTATTAETTTAETTTTTSEPSWVAYDHDNGVMSPSGRWFQLDMEPTFIYPHGELALFKSGFELYVADDSNGRLYIISPEEQMVLAYTVSYDTVYWYTLDREVWACDWWTSTEAYLFYEDAVGVSPFSDEGEGAIVRPGEENLSFCWEAYGLPIYSPYGEGYTLPTDDSATTTTTTTTVVSAGD